MLCWAMAIYKSQGLTIPKVVIDLSNKEYQSGLSYVAFSRVKQLENLIVEPHHFDRLE